MTGRLPAWFVIALWLVGPAVTARAVSPLVTDDADTVPPGQLQVNSDFTFIRTGSTTLYSVPINPVAGLLPSLEVGADFGYQWRQGPRSASTTGDADSVTDLTIAPKFQLGEVLEGKLKFGARIDLTLPTASDRHGLGTGKLDAGSVGIATYTVGNTAFDFNVGYYAIDALQIDFDDDQWFIGQTVRQALNTNWNVFAEAYAFIPNTGDGGQATFYFSGGPQWVVTKNVAICALIGTAAGHKSPDLTGTFEIACQF
jgi:Putative MetA-pathway of phenol degradation